MIFVPKRNLVLPQSLRRRQLGFFAPAGIGNSMKVGAADFDGTNDYMRRGAGLTGAADSKSGILSCWVRLDGGNGTSMALIDNAATLGGSDTRFFAYRINTNIFRILATTSAGLPSGNILQLDTVGTYTSGAAWLHLLSSWKLDTALARHLYINDTSDLSAVVFTNGTIDYTVADWVIGSTSPAGGNKLNGTLAELYFAPGQYLDFSVEANRRKFITAASKPAYLGRNGSKPTGIAPLVYQHLAKGEAVANFATNRGTAGNFTLTGALDYADGP